MNWESPAHGVFDSDPANSLTKESGKPLGKLPGKPGGQTFSRISDLFSSIFHQAFPPIFIPFFELTTARFPLFHPLHHHHPLYITLLRNKGNRGKHA